MRISRLPGIHHDADSVLIADRGEVALINAGTSWYQLLSEERIHGELRQDEKLGHLLLGCRRFNYAGGAAHLCESFAAEVHIHSEGVNALAIGDHFSTWASRFDSDMPVIEASALSDGQEIPVGRVSIKAVSLPGHCTDAMGFLIEERALLAAGPTLPLEDHPSRWDMPTGCLPDLADSLEEMLDLELEMLLPGQGPAIDGRERVQQILERHRDFFDVCIEDDGRMPEGWMKPSPTANYLSPLPKWS